MWRPLVQPRHGALPAGLLTHNDCDVRPDPPDPWPCSSSNTSRKVFRTPRACCRCSRTSRFDVEEGEFVAIVGPSGCGKSTLLRIINGIVPMTSGQVLVPRPPGRRDQSRMRAGVPVVRAAAVAVGQGQRRARPRGAGIAAGRARKARRRLYRQGRTRRLRGGLPARAVRRDEAARRFRARARGRAQGAADGRAVLRARRPDRDHAARRIARHLAVARHAGEKSSSSSPTSSRRRSSWPIASS